MTPFIVFGVSGGLIAFMLLFKYWENKSGNVYFRSLRRKLDNLIVREVEIRGEQIPRVFEGGAQRSRTMLVYIIHETALVALAGIRFVEQRLVRFLDFIRGRHGHHIRNRKQASSYLRDIAEEKDRG